MTEAPFLSLIEIRQEVERIFRREHRSRMVALVGRGEPYDFDLGGEIWRVVPTRCELDLRERLPAVGRPPSGIVFLVDWTVDVLPLDVACRLAGGRLYHVARDARLAALFGARQVEPGLAESALARLLLSGALAQPRKVQSPQLTRTAAWTSLLEARLRVSEAAFSSAGALLSWAASSDAGPAFVRQADGDDLWRNVRRELHDWLARTVGDLGLLIWQTWERGAAPRLLEVLPLLKAARDAADPFAAGQLMGQLVASLPDLAARVRELEPMLIDDALVDAALPVERGRLIATLERSQAIAAAAGLERIAQHSLRLPGGHTARERALAASVHALLAAPDTGNAVAVVEAMNALEGHTLDPHLRSTAHRAARRNLGRLALWLTGRPPGGPPGARWQPAVDLACRYAEEGGYVEWARQQLRGLRGADEHLLQAARALDAAVTVSVLDEHRRFADAYVSWVEAGKPSSAALPIEDLGKHVIAPYLRGNARRRLLIVLMDGMSQTAAVQLLAHLGATRRWGPVAWRRDGWSGVLPLPPVLAVAPTLTELSRAAFFAGRAEPRSYDEGTEKDPARWRAHRAVADLLGEDAPPLFMRRDLLSGHDLATDIRDAIKGESRAVAVIVNAIDEDLKSSVQVFKDYSQTPVLPLEALLSAAEEGERAVLLTADHGHILGDGVRTLPGRLGAGRPGGPRWRALASGESPAEEEVVLPASAWVPRGWHRVASLWDPNVVNRAAAYGEHGGLSLAEAVCPTLLIAPDWLERTQPDDPSLAVRALPTPDWWELRPPRAARRAPPPPSPSPQEPRAQTSLFAREAPAAPPPTTSVAAPLVESLRRSPLFQAQIQGHAVAEVDRVLQWLGVLAAAGGTLSAAEFATAAGVRPHQVGGAIARMGILNADGFAMVEHDHVGRRVLLHRARLEQHYGVRI